jgi:hypothetical protein
MKKLIVGFVVAFALVAGACSQDVTASEEYQSLETEAAALEQKLAYTEGELTAARESSTGEAIPVEVVAILDEWWAANDRADGSVVDVYTTTGYHLYGDKKVSHEELAAHFDARGWTSEWISEPYLVADEPEGRYVVTRGIRNTNTSVGVSVASALTFEIVTATTGEMEIAQSTFLYVLG